MCVWGCRVGFVCVGGGVGEGVGVLCVICVCFTHVYLCMHIHQVKEHLRMYYVYFSPVILQALCNVLL